MKIVIKRVVVFGALLILGLTALHAQNDGALLDALVRKGLLTDQEAEDVRNSEIKDYAQTAASKLSLSNHISNLKLYGDVRYRFEYLDEKAQNPLAEKVTSGGTTSNYGPGSTTTERNRYRLRLGVDYTFTDNFSAGFELESNSAADSANQSFGNGFGKFGINVGLVYLQWKPNDWLTLVGGKQRNPLYTTDILWDPDINPEGGSEILSFQPTEEFSIGLTAGQYIYADNAENNPTISGTVPVANTLANPLPKSDIWIFAQQVPIQYNFDKDTFVKEVPGFTSYMGGGNSGTGGTDAVGAWSGSAVSFVGPHAADHLQLLTAPGEVDWKIGSVPFKAYWDFIYNLEGKQRIQETYFRASTPGGADAANLAVISQNRNLGDNIAWLAGLQVGQNKKKGDWSIKGDFRQVGLGATDPNLNDSDWGDSFLNQQGVRIVSAYNFTDFLTGTVTFIDTWDYKQHLLDGSSTGQNSGLSTTLPISGGSGNTIAGGTTAGVTTNLAGVNSTQRVEVDLQWKF